MAIFNNNNIRVVQQGTREYPPKSGIIAKRTTFFIGIDIPGDDNDIEDPE